MPAEINWFELPAADTAKARGFYGRLFGWRTNGVDGDYHVIDDAAGAIAARTNNVTHPRLYFATDDLDTSVRLVRELGGTTNDIMSMPGTGRIAHCRDNQSTSFSLYEPTRQS